MLPSKLSSIAAFAGMMAASFYASAPAALGGPPPVEGQAEYLPIQNVSYEFGTKMMSGYFVRHAENCLVNLMIIERGDPEAPLPPSPARVRLALYPGQIAGLDSEEGRSLNFTCGDQATTMLVVEGERDRLVELHAEFAQTTANALAILVPAARSGSPAPLEDQARFLPIQNFSSEFGSKYMSGYFVPYAATCFVNLMITERGDPEAPLALSATRVRHIMYPGQIAGLDSEEGRSLNFTCGDKAATMLVNAGDRDRLEKLQASIFPDVHASSP
jgi:hypothetical protein